MDFTLPIIGLVGLIGYQFNKKNNPNREPEQEIRTTIAENEIPSGTNVLKSRHVDKARSDEYKKASKRSTESNIIPAYYNSICKSKDNSTPLREFKDTILPSVKTVPKQDKTREQRIFNGPMFLDAQKDIVSTGFQSSSSGGFESILKNNEQGQLKETFSNLSGKPLDMKHNNMVPFFGSKMTQDMKPQSGLAVQRMERFTGNLDTPQRKKEVPSMFENKKQNVYGSLPISQLIEKDRYYQSDKQNNVLPFAQIKIQPMLEEDTRPTFKNVDELRTKNNQKISYEGRFKPAGGVNGNYNRGTLPNLQKNKPDTFYINDASRYSAPSSINKAPASRENFKDMKVTTKGETSEIPVNMGAGFNSEMKAGGIPWAKQSNSSKSPLQTIASDDSRNTFKNDWVRNAGYSISKPNEIEKTSHVAYEQERETTNRMELTNPKYYTTAQYVPFADEARPTHKESNLYEYHGAARGPINKPVDYTGAYNYTKERQSINNPNYKGTPGAKVGNTERREAYVNSSEHIRSNKQNVANKEDYMPNSSHDKLPAGKEYVNIYQRDDSLRKINYPANINRLNVEPPSYQNSGSVSSTKKENVEHDFLNRIDPDILNAYKKNPYTQSLSSI